MEDMNLSEQNPSENSEDRKERSNPSDSRRNQNERTNPSDQSSIQSEQQRLREIRRMLAFDKKPEYVEEIIQRIPTGKSSWRFHIVLGGDKHKPTETASVSYNVTMLLHIKHYWMIFLSFAIFFLFL